MENFGFIPILLISVGLAMDAFAVSISSGLAITRLKLSDAMKIALCFGFFQAFMPLIGYLVGGFFHSYIENYDHWVVLILLSYIGGKMIYEGYRHDETKIKGNPVAPATLLFLGIATSIDALVVGINLALVKANIFFSVSVIGITTFLISFIGVIFGRKFGEMLGQKAEIGGGLVLIGIGIKVLIEHLSA